VRFATKLNFSLKEYDLGTLPTIDKDEDYLQMYQDVIQVESGLPYFIVRKIHRNILLSISLNSLRILRSDSSFWDDIETQKTRLSMSKALVLIRNSLGMLMVTLDEAISGLRGEISSDIDRYVEGIWNGQL
ncbi:hypothetical protein ACFLV5_05770, partial [Chloroflexota bacterium]